MRVVFLVNGPHDSPGAERARRIAGALGDDDVELVLRAGSRLADLPRFLVSALRGCDVLYAVDLAAVPVLAGAIGRTSGSFIVDTGDAPADFLRLVRAGRAKVAAAEALERVGYRMADALVVRGQCHVSLLRDLGVDRVHLIPDGVDLDVVVPREDSHLRQRLGLANVFTVGIAGSFSWFHALDGGGGPGWELVQALAALPDLPIHGVLIGEGAGLAHLRVLADRLGVGARLHVMGRVPYHELARYLGLCDVCLLTLSNHRSSQVRTSGKLPVYLAAGRYILSSRVGTAAQVLPDEMLLDYHGGWDLSYPERLAGRLTQVMDDPDRRDKGLAGRRIADMFDYKRVARDAARLIQATARPSGFVGSVSGLSASARAGPGTMR